MPGAPLAQRLAFADLKLQEASSAPTSRSLRRGNLCAQPEQLVAISQTLDTYSHVLKGMDGGIGGAMDEALG
jgi:hypothetical protein